MTNAGKKRPLLLLVALAMLLCGAMALGGTLANNDSSETMEYDVQVFCYNPDSTSEDKYDLPLYGENAYKPFTTDVKWCPGYTKIVYLKITNNEEFPVDCELDIAISDNGFNDVMSYAVIYGLQPGAKEHPNNWTDFKNKANVSSILNKESHGITKKVLVSSGDANARYYALAIHMDENADNDYQGKSMQLSFNLRVNADYEPNATPNN